MRCAKCTAENREGRKFCAECSAALNVRCPSCRAENQPAEKFCGECGAELSAPLGSSITETPLVHVAGERRHLTILFCDLVGSTTLAAQLDPEEWHEMVAAYQRVSAEAITRFGGDVRRYVGDGIMAFFGYPVAHDNDAERGARAGLAIVEGIAELNKQPGRVNLAVRIGINSGRVVVGAGAGKEVDAFGDAANVAARVEMAAEPGTVALTEATQRLVSGLFVVEDLGAHTLKGIARPVQLYRVIRPSGMRGRFEAVAAAGGLTPFVGREDELRSLLNRWERVIEGEGQVALIIGEAGIGKSRLLQRFHEEIAGTPHIWFEAGGGAFFQNTPFYPVTEMLGQFLGHQASLREELMSEGGALEDAPQDDQLAQLSSRLKLAGLKPEEAIPLIAPLLNLPLPAEYPPATLSPEQRRRRLLATLVEWVLGAARVQPLVIAIEDLHWVDPSTLELIQLLAEQGATGRLMLLYTARPEFHASWPQRAHHMQMTLDRLSAGNVRAMVGEVAARKSLSDETIAAVVERTGGVPLFVEELTRAVLENGSDQAIREIPATLHDSLMARLDRLGPAKEVIQIGAVIGSDFSYELLHAVHPMGEADLHRALRSLTGAELLYVRGIAPEATYQFKHALIRDAAYEALLKSHRKELHLNVARTIEEKFPAIKETQPEMIARHWTEAGAIDPAITAWQSAGGRAVGRSAMVEAARHYGEALELLGTLPEDGERDRREFELQLSLGPAIIAVRGYAAPEVERAFARARELCERFGDPPEISPVLFGLWSMYLVRGELHKAAERAEQLVRRAQQLSDRKLLMFAEYAVGQTAFFMGKFTAAGEHLAAAISIYDPEHDEPLGFLYGGVDSGVAFLSYMAWVQWHLGYADRALKRANETFALAQKLSHHISSAWAEYFVGVLWQYRGDPRVTQELAENSFALSAEQHFTLFLAFANGLRGWATAAQGRDAEGITRIQESLNLLRTIGAELARPYTLALLAEACLAAGRLDDGLSALEEAFTIVNKLELRIYEVEMHRLKGELLLAQNNSKMPEAEECFERAIALARKQSAKSLELRATTSLARLLERQGNRDEARTRLAAIYHWFTEGFDTANLKDAKTLLDELDIYQKKANPGGAHGSS